MCELDGQVPDLSECEMNTFDGKRPPVPDFGRPVDYVGWMNRYLAEDRDVNAARIYDGFWRYGDTKEHMPEPSQPVKEALVALACGTVQQSARYSEVEQYMKRAAPYVEIFKSASQNTGYCLQVRRDPETPLTGAVFPWIASGEDALLVLLASAWNDEGARLSKLQEAWIVGLNHARHLMDAKSLLTIAQANHVRMVIYKSVLSAVQRGVLTGEGSVKTLELLTRTHATEPRLTSAFYLGWASQLAFLQALYPKGRLNRTLAKEIGGLDETGGVHSLDVWGMRNSDQYLAAVVCELDKYFIGLLHISREAIGLPAIQKIGELQAELNNGPVGSHGLRPFLFYDPRKDYKHELRARAMHRAVRLVLMLHDFQARHSEWPEKLASLEMPGSSEFLVDPFSEKQLIYRQWNASFLLYSVGEDQIDNSGKHGKWSRWYPAEVGTDFVFWPPQD
ncbi:MAG: hypothetical protein ACYTEX_27245 [Planctomycetota bacterium]